MRILMDLHTHTVASGHAYSTIMENAKAAAEKGLEGIAMTDHGPAMPGGAHLYHFWNLTALPQQIAGVRVLRGVEANIIDSRGGLDVPADILDRLDIVLAGLHGGCIRSGTTADNTRAMLAGSGSLFQEHLGLPSVVGAVAMTVVIAATLCLNLHRIVDLISAVTPFLIVMVVIVVSYALFNNSGADTAALEAVAVQGEKAAGHWALSGLLYASFNIAVGFPLLAVLAGSDTNLRNTTWGGIYGGLGLGALIFLLNIGLFFNIDQIQNAQMPTVLLAKGVGSWIGVLMMVSVFCMIYSTGVGMFFAFTARFAMPNTKKFRLIGLASCLVGLLLSFAGFTKLVGTVYPLLGYLGLALIAAVLVYWLRNRGKSSVAA